MGRQYKTVDMMILPEQLYMEQLKTGQGKGVVEKAPVVPLTTFGIIL